jgi:response regulator RpfG family c-di-GMP phosphodiesterase
MVSVKYLNMNNNILIIDDEEKLRNLIEKLVSLEGFNVYQASDCKSGLKQLERNDIELLFARPRHCSSVYITKVFNRYFRIPGTKKEGTGLRIKH